MLLCEFQSARQEGDRFCRRDRARVSSLTHIRHRLLAAGSVLREGLAVALSLAVPESSLRILGVLVLGTETVGV